MFCVFIECVMRRSVFWLSLCPSFAHWQEQRQERECDENEFLEAAFDLVRLIVFHIKASHVSVRQWKCLSGRFRIDNFELICDRWTLRIFPGRGQRTSKVVFGSFYDQACIFLLLSNTCCASDSISPIQFYILNGTAYICRALQIDDMAGMIVRIMVTSIFWSWRLMVYTKSRDMYHFYIWNIYCQSIAHGSYRGQPNARWHRLCGQQNRIVVESSCKTFDVKHLREMMVVLFVAIIVNLTIT